MLNRMAVILRAFLLEGSLKVQQEILRYAQDDKAGLRMIRLGS